MNDRQIKAVWKMLDYGRPITDVEMTFAGALLDAAADLAAPVAAQELMLDHSFDHLAGRGLHELRTDELPAYLATVAHNHGARSSEFSHAAQWVAAELERKTNDERVLAVKLAELREKAQSEPAAWICIYDDGEVDCTPLRELAEAAPKAIPLYRAREVG